MNKAILVGNLTKDPELSSTSNGIAVCKFTIAVNRPFTNSEGEREADFMNIIVWREKGENANKYLRKGKKAGIVGSIQTRSYEDKEGIKRYVTEIIADEVEYLSPSEKHDSGLPEPPPERKAAELKPVDEPDRIHVAYNNHLISELFVF